MDAETKRAAVRAYKEREVPAGIYRILCPATGKQWVGRAPDLGTIRNRHWSGLRFGGCPIRSLSSAWAEHGEAAFLFEELERLPADTSIMSLPRLLKARHEHWVEALGAEAI
ncbi:MAG: GIY-YIG nuclease family protein [Alphaproteobacteria bacterium]|nr:MAG: GIY-YIG nuclease family protein [Alphaproteobacteria bacterium]